MFIFDEKRGKCQSCGTFASKNGTIISINFKDGAPLNICWDCSETLHDILEDKIKERYENES